jgi:hypothetical protein
MAAMGSCNSSSRQLRLDDFLRPIDDPSNHAIPISRTGPAESFWKLRWRQMPDYFDKSARNSDRSWIKGDISIGEGCGCYLT